MAQKNCWEFKKCGRELGGANSARLGVCPAAIEARSAETGSGKIGCRPCWAISGKFSEDAMNDSLESKLGDCLNCGFLK